MIYMLMPVIFLAGIIGIAFEEKIKVNKAAVALLMCTLLWGLLLFDNVQIFSSHPKELLHSLISKFPEFGSLPFSEQCALFIDTAIIQHLGDVSTTLFFVMASMVIIDLVDVHGGFGVFIPMIKTRNKRAVLWIIAFLTFFLSALLGNLATVIIIISLLRKIVRDNSDRLIYACMTIIAANAGGSWSPIGDVTTLLLWTGKTISAGHQVLHVFPSSLVMMLIPLTLVTFMFPKNSYIIDAGPDQGKIRLSRRIRYTLLAIGLVSFVMVPVLQTLLGIPPFMVALAGVVVLWVYTDLLYAGKHSAIIDTLKVNSTFSRIDMSTILFFLGILMSVAALQTAGQLGNMSTFLDTHVGKPELISFILGICSSFLDNVALVAGTIGMYPIAETGAFMSNGIFWTFLAYCAVTGGSILIIGSAAGVTVMGMEKISFGYYFKRFSLLALLGYVGGAAVFLLLN